MSRASYRKPEFRLYLGYPDVVLTRSDRVEPVGTAEPDTPGFGPALRRFAAEVARERGRLTVVLPRDEVWRGRLDLGGHPRAARRTAARAAIAARMGVAPSGLRVVFGRRDPAGSQPAAAVRAATLDGTRALLADASLRPAAIVGAGAHPGFAKPPRLDAAAWPRSGFAVGGAALAAAVLAFLAWPAEPPQPVIAEAVAALQLPAPIPAAQPAVPAAPPLSLAPRRADQPPSRPEPAFAQIGNGALVSMGTRSVVLTRPRPDAEPKLVLAELTSPRATMTDATIEPPLPRPVVAPRAVEADLRPMHRPGSPAANPSPVAPALPALSAADGRPLPRPATRQPVVVASLDPAPPAASLRAPLARPAALSASVTDKPAAKPTVKVVVPAQPAVQQPVALAPRAVTPAPQPVRQKTVAAPAPMAVRQPASVALATSATQKRGLSRGSVSLIGVFGSEEGRHALLRLPNGAIQRVSAGDSIQGVQVAAVGPDSVRLSGRGRDTVLRLPD